MQPESHEFFCPPVEKDGLNEGKNPSLRRALGLTQQQFADGNGVKRDTVSNYEIGRNTPTETVLQMICRVYGVRREWLDTGIGKMFQERSRLEQIKDLSKDYLKDENNSFRLRLISVIAELSEDQLEVLAEVAERIVGEGRP